ncbi:thioredoxin domain-containing protein 17-like [Lingula anatina]|uniref:Thioredoxin domain-containing protein 17 n=1 Tax=Lingula anatina TaxID=7574 RepID=A0A1S3IJL9_LINAN|nr:thioredoxin domain-containing protein 17-like [Lingula anatina]|eukprot:XP_013398308.1 thioredoxin domain-containing protein 17-like [Lingula anatina]
MVQQIHVEGHEAFMKTATEHKGKLVFALFSSSKDGAGSSWCPDCVKAEPVVKECMKFVPDEAVFIECGVGDKPFWKDPNNIFRKDDKLRLKCVPTLMRWGTPQRLEEEQCADSRLVQMLFEDE